MKWTPIFLVSFLLTITVSVKAQSVAINQVLFSEGGQSWTARDMSLYAKLVKVATGSEKLTLFSEGLVDDFLLSRILKREALLFEIKPQKFELSASAKAELNEFSKREIETEMVMISYALALLEFKQTQVSQKLRFAAWMDVLKRKYSVKMKNHGT
ncbi:MAG: hypothetical protein A2622_11475 [Bdellovibrionales bacterium RIFCSPHIGHO2_01_FULL_40_29]|nr:MAG: hypothetical protein A2622_11475 [Bdellovibrionales bacterium RIFCSPHIGHO2_01_FULL_40_29]OFZ34568.1 MAG: hypothetical protein A3D17_01740 [Bdellovibrionales bacterium RIFCSPHIGHO2_02_FULL_40_15]